MDVNVTLPSEDEGDEPVPPQVSATQKWDCDVPDCTSVVKGTRAHVSSARFRYNNEGGVGHVGLPSSPG